MLNPFILSENQIEIYSKRYIARCEQKCFGIQLYTKLSVKQTSDETDDEYNSRYMRIYAMEEVEHHLQLKSIHIMESKFKCIDNLNLEKSIEHCMKNKTVEVMNDEIKQITELKNAIMLK